MCMSFEAGVLDALDVQALVLHVHLPEAREVGEDVAGGLSLRSRYVLSCFSYSSVIWPLRMRAAPGAAHCGPGCCPV
jgi:hypothetical protein